MIDLITAGWVLGQKIFAGFDAIRKGLARGTMSPEEAAKRGADLMAEADAATTAENAKLAAAVAAYAEVKPAPDLMTSVDAAFDRPKPPKPRRRRRKPEPG